MRERNTAAIMILLMTAGCVTQTASTRSGAGKVSEAVAALAAPGQDLASARLVPEDGCYWYEHRGPVETTLVPLRTINGNPICIARDS